MTRLAALSVLATCLLCCAEPRWTEGSQSRSTASAPVLEGLSIGEIQGTEHRSPLEGHDVRDVRGVVTAVDERGFFLQSSRPDADERTSEALFVKTERTPEVQVGDRLSVDARVVEWRPFCERCDERDAEALLSSTELGAPLEVRVQAREQSLPEPVRIGSDERPVPSSLRALAGGDKEQVGTVLDPASDALDFYESLEGMRVEVHTPQALGPAKGGLIPIAPTRETDDQDAELALFRAWPARLWLDAARVPNAERVGRGSKFDVDLEGVIDSRSGGFGLWLQSAPSPVGQEERPLALPQASSQELSLASLNVHNLNLGDPAEKFEHFAQLVVDSLQSPDLLALQEVQDDSGAADDGVKISRETLTRLTSEIEAHGGPRYDAAQLDPVDGADGGEPGGNIRQVLLYQSSRGLKHLARAGAAASTENRVLPGPRLEFSPGRIAPESEAFTHSRKPLAAQFEFTGRTLFVIGVHFVSKLGDQPALGRFQPPLLRSEPSRVAQMQHVVDFVRALLVHDPAVLTLVLGDFNDDLGSAVLEGFEEAGLVSLCELTPRPCYTYVYEGRAQALDHVLLSRAWLPRVTGFEPLHVHAGVANAPTDHDPLWARLTVPAAD